MPKPEVSIDLSKINRSYWINQTLTSQEAAYIESLDETIIEERMKQQRKNHQRRKEGSDWTKAQWEAVVRTYEVGGFTHKEGVWLADDRISPESEIGTELLARRTLRVKLYIEEMQANGIGGNLRLKAIQESAKELRRHNRKRGNIDEYMYSEGTVN